MFKRRGFRDEHLEEMMSEQKKKKKKNLILWIPKATLRAVFAKGPRS